jgi:hypothetical protein
MANTRWAGLRMLAALAILSACVNEDSSPAHEYRPPADLARLQSRAAAGPEVPLVRDFDVAGDTLYLLQRSAQVSVLVRAGAEWRLVRQFGRLGGGPGEFLNASGLALTTAGDLAIIEASRLQFLRTDGSALSAHRPDLPCPVALPGVVERGGGIYIHGNCVRRGAVTDTIKAVVAWSADSVSYAMLAQDVRFTRDGTVGHIFGAFNALTPGDGSMLFGVGVRGCVVTLVDRDTEPTGAERCGLAHQLYRAPPPPELEARLRAGGVAGMRARWPDALPVYIDRTAVGNAVILLRPFTADSIVLQLAQPDGRDLAVAPLDPFIGCKAGGCLWAFDDDPSRILLLTAAEMLELIASAGGRSP